MRIRGHQPAKYQTGDTFSNNRRAGRAPEPVPNVARESQITSSVPGADTETVVSEASCHDQELLEMFEDCV